MSLSLSAVAVEVTKSPAASRNKAIISGKNSNIAEPNIIATTGASFAVERIALARRSALGVCLSAFFDAFATAFVFFFVTFFAIFSYCFVSLALAIFPLSLSNREVNLSDLASLN